MCEGDLFDDMLHVVWAGSCVEEVVSKRSGTSFALSGDEMPSVNKEGDPHHAQWAPLGDSTVPSVSFPKAGGK